MHINIFNGLLANSVGILYSQLLKIIVANMCGNSPLYQNDPRLLYQMVIRSYVVKLFHYLATNG